MSADPPVSQQFARRLTLLYSVALATVALLSLVGQGLVQQSISRQRDDSTIINIAGRQRMLSQRIAKSALAAVHRDFSKQGEHIDELRHALAEWVASHGELVGASRGQNSAVVAQLFAGLEPARKAMVAAGEKLVWALPVFSDTEREVGGLLDTILSTESDFLQRMDAIVSQYELEAQGRIERLRQLELALLCVTLSVLLAEALLVFRPAVRSIRDTLQRLGTSEAERARMAGELGTIVDSVPALILYHDREGKIIRVNKSGAEIIGESMYKLHGSSVYGWFPDDSVRFREEDEWIYANDAPRLGLVHYLRNSQGEVRWLRMNKVPYHDVDRQVIGTIIFAVDVSAHKRLEKRLMELRAEEQRHLGYNLHDGLGQHLSGILYLGRRLENRLRGKADPEADNAAEVVNLVKESIESVRNLSQGLRPLGDEPNALPQALAELVRKTKETTGIDCVFEESGTVLVFESDVAEHLFRIGQEAINNAVRHSGGTRIAVTLRQGDDETVLEVSDNGQGLDAETWRKGRQRGGDAGGLGLSIMEHRAELMGGAFNIEALPEGGTRVRCSLKI